MNGVFWTIRIPESAVSVEAGSGRATLALADVTMPDFGTVIRSLQGLAPIATGTLSLRIDWSGAARRVNLSVPSLATPFAGEFVQNTAVMTWSESLSGSAISGLAKSSDFAVVGHERNGVFFG